jgi:hypothetical protein
MYLSKFVSLVSETLLVYYSGHGIQIPSQDPEEIDGLDEAFLFTDSHVVDNVLLDLLKKDKSPSSKLIVISDCCHSGTIWDLDHRIAPPNCISVGCCNDEESGHQSNNQYTSGYFTNASYNFYKINPNMTPIQLKKAIDKDLKIKQIW